MHKKLRDLPGPKGYPLVGMIPKLDLPDLHNQIEGWADEFGDVFRLNLGYTSQTVVTRPSIIQKICMERPDDFIRLKKMDNVLRDGKVHGVFNAEGREWVLHRKVVAKGLDVRHQQQFYPTMIKSLDRLYKKWLKNAEDQKPFDIQKDLMRFTVDISSSLAFGVEMNTIEQQGSVIQDQMEKVFPMLFKRINDPIPFYKIYKTKADKEFDKAVQAMTDLVDEFVAAGKERIKNNPELKENPSNVLESILNAAEEEGGFSDKEVRGNLLTLLIAGEDTTALTLIWMIYLLTIHTNVQKGIREEADRVLGDAPWLSKYDDAKELKFIEGAAMESLRFKPVAPIMLFQATRDMEIEELNVKKGQRFLTQYRVGAMSDKFFSNADEFNPERWMKMSKCPVHNQDAFIPFGAGPRFCPGRNLAILEIRMIITMLFKNFNVEMVTPHADVNEIMAFTMMASDYRVKLTKRV